MVKNIFKGIGNTIRIAIKLVLVVLLIAGSYIYLDKVFANKDVDRADSFHSLPENCLDIGVIGSSHAQYSFIPNFFYTDLGLYSYVLGTPCQPLEVSVEMLKEMYKKQRPKLIVLEVYTALPLSAGCAGDSCYVTASYQATGEERKNILNMLPLEKSKTYFNEFINNHNNWRNVKTLEELEPLERKPLEETANSFGYVDAYPSFPVANYWSPLQFDSDVEVELREKDINALNEILRLCKEHGSELLLYKTPVDGLTQEDQSYLHKVWQWADENGVRYIDFIKLADSLGYHMQTHTNSGHAYINGASIISDYLCEYIRDNYPGIFDHKQNDAVDAKHNKMTFDFLKASSENEYNPLVYMNRIFKYKDGTVVVRYNKWAGTINDELYNKMISLGVKEGFRDNCYYAIYNKGQLIVDSTEPFEYEIDGKLIKIETDRVLVNGEEIDYWTGAPLSLTVFNENFERRFVKRINTKTNWEFNYTFYGE